MHHTCLSVDGYLGLLPLFLKDLDISHMPMPLSPSLLFPTG